MVSLGGPCTVQDNFLSVLEVVSISAAAIVRRSIEAIISDWASKTENGLPVRLFLDVDSAS